jgi:hypothetical protein
MDDCHLSFISTLIDLDFNNIPELDIGNYFPTFKNKFDMFKVDTSYQNMKFRGLAHVWR